MTWMMVLGSYCFPAALLLTLVLWERGYGLMPVPVRLRRSVVNPPVHRRLSRWH